MRLNSCIQTQITPPENSGEAPEHDSSVQWDTRVQQRRYNRSVLQPGYHDWFKVLLLR